MASAVSNQRRWKTAWILVKTNNVALWLACLSSLWVPNAKFFFLCCKQTVLYSRRNYFHLTSISVNFIKMIVPEYYQIPGGNFSWRNDFKPALWYFIPCLCSPYCQFCFRFIKRSVFPFSSVLSRFILWLSITTYYLTFQSNAIYCNSRFVDRTEVIKIQL